MATGREHRPPCHVQALNTMDLTLTVAHALTRVVRHPGRSHHRGHIDTIGLVQSPGPDPRRHVRRRQIQPSKSVFHRTSEGEDRYERMGRGFHESLRAGYRHLARSEPERCCLIDASVDADAVAARVWEDVAPLMETV